MILVELFGSHAGHVIVAHGFKDFPRNGDGIHAKVNGISHMLIVSDSAKHDLGFKAILVFHVNDA